jgi:hypothetical protein
MAVGIGLKQRQHRATSGGGVLFFHGNLRGKSLLFEISFDWGAS